MMFAPKAATILGAFAWLVPLASAGLTFLQSKVLNADFSKGPGDFQYIDDTFRSTVQPKYADGLYDAKQGAVCVVLGGLDFDDLWDMSGAWKSTFQLDEDDGVEIMVEYAMFLSKSMDNGDDLETMVSIDGNLVGSNAQRDFVDQLKGEDGDVKQSTGYKTATLSAGRLSAGKHEILIGGFLLTKNNLDEVGKVCYKTVMVTTVEGGANEPTEAPTEPITFFPTVEATGVGSYADSGTEIPAVTSAPIDPSTSAPVPRRTPNPTPDPMPLRTSSPTSGPTSNPSSSPSSSPTSSPSSAPVPRRTPNPTPDPTGRPTPNPTSRPTPNPTARPTPSPTARPTSSPTPAPVLPPIAPGTSGNKIVNANFDKNTDGFTYMSDAFFQTNNSKYVSGRLANGGLSLWLGGKDNKKVTGMSAGWMRQFTLTRSASVQLMFDVQIWLSDGSDSHQFVQALATVNSNNFISLKLSGESNKKGLFSLDIGKDKSFFSLKIGGGSREKATTGKRTFNVNVGTLPAGSHKLVLGAFMNEKTAADEQADLRFDNVMVSIADGPVQPVQPVVPRPILVQAPRRTPNPTSAPVRSPPSKSSVIIDADFDKSTEHFVYRDDVFGGKGNGKYARGDHWKDGNGRKLAVILGGVDNHDIKGMSGAWQRKFRVSHTSLYSLTFRYMMYSTGHEEPGEYGEAILSINGEQEKLVKIDGLEQTAKVSTGWRTFSGKFNLSAGKDIELSLGGYFNLKTTSGEKLTIVFDDLALKN